METIIELIKSLSVPKKTVSAEEVSLADMVITEHATEPYSQEGQLPAAKDLKNDDGWRYQGHHQTRKPKKVDYEAKVRAAIKANQEQLP